MDAVDVVSVQFFAAGDHQAGCPFEMPRLPAAILLARGSCFDSSDWSVEIPSGNLT